MTIGGHVRIEWERIETAHRNLAATCDGVGMHADAGWHRELAEQVRDAGKAITGGEG